MCIKLIKIILAFSLLVIYLFYWRRRAVLYTYVPVLWYVASALARRFSLRSAVTAWRYRWPGMVPFVLASLINHLSPQTTLLPPQPALPSRWSRWRAVST